MMYPFLTLDDNTEIVPLRAAARSAGEGLYRKADEKDCFHYATCYLPAYRWVDVNGFTEDEIRHYQEILESTAHLIIKFSAEGGFDGAANF